MEIGKRAGVLLALTVFAGADRAWWSEQSSKLPGVRGAGPGGFDSHTLPPPQQPAEVGVSAVTEFIAVKPGTDLRVGVRLGIPEGWTLGWTNPGGRGTATSLAWRWDRWIRAGQTIWPFPSLDTTHTANVYRGDVWLLTTFHVSPRAPQGTVELRGRLGWSLCREACASQQRDISVTVAVDTMPAPSPGWPVAEQAMIVEQAVPLRSRFVRAGFDRDSLRLTILLPGGPPAGSDLTFFPAAPPRVAVVTRSHGNRSVTWIRLPAAVRDGVGRVSGVLVSPAPWGVDGPVAFAVDAHVPARGR